MSEFFNSCCLKFDGIPYPLPREVPELLSKGAIVVDLREEIEIELRAFGIEKVIYLPHSEFEERWPSLPGEFKKKNIGIYSITVSATK